MPAARFVDRLAKWTAPESRGASRSFCAALLDQYLMAADSDRIALRAAVRRNHAVWNPAGGDALSEYLSHAAARLSPVASLRVHLTACALTGGLGDWRDTIAWLTRLWSSAGDRGVDPRPHFAEIGDAADDGNVHGESGLSTRGLFRNAVRLAVSGRGDDRRPKEPPADPAAPCPACETPLRTARARQCFACGADWHDAPADATRPRAAEDVDATRDRTGTDVSRRTDPPDGSESLAAVPEFTPGDRYRFGDELARGGMGVVYRATDTAFGREVAIKVW